MLLCRDEKFNLKNEITEKHRRAIENYEEVLERRENEIRDSKYGLAFLILLFLLIVVWLFG